MNKFWRFAPWLTRLMLVPPTLIFTLIASRYLFDPVHEGGKIGLAYNAPLAITVTRVGFGAFPLAFAIFTLSCIVSARRVMTGLSFVAMIMAVALIVRVAGMLNDGTVHESMALVRAEAIMLALFIVGIFIERGSRNQLSRAT
ncbi:MAG TPA: hypothetical protein VEW69_09860 [Alphaproteobacteria bacterium]|nr:hypothetical protein [Alphaproteobacteria bacterium]